MKDVKFNLIDEKWIRVIDDSCRITELSLSELFRHAHEYEDLRGELPAQDTAVMRILLAVLHTVVARYDEHGEECDAETAAEVMRRWETIWEAGRFPADVIDEYLNEWHDKFWLFHPTHPFMQEPLARLGTEYKASKLNGELSESNNKDRLFRMYAGEDKERLSYPQAARWLLYVNAFDDTSAKPSSLSRSRKVKYGSPGAGWLGKIGIITLKGNNLFETLMLNMVMVSSDGSEPIGEEQIPSWEEKRYIPKDQENIRIEKVERVDSAMPDNLAELYSFQSRRMLLERDERGVTGCGLLGGKYFDRENSFIEPMTVWRNSGNKKKDIFTPKRHDPSKQLWREFGSIYTKHGSSERRPGVIVWFEFIKSRGYIPAETRLNTRICSVHYGDKDFFIDDVFSDALSMNGELVLSGDEHHLKWQACITEAIADADKAADAVGSLSRELYIAGGGDTEKAKEQIGGAKEKYYFAVDKAFREWLANIDPSHDDTVATKQKWIERAKYIARGLGKEMVDRSGTNAIIGRTVTINDKAVMYSAAKAENAFNYRLSLIK